MTKEELSKQIDLKTRLIYIYSNVMLGDAIDGYITDLERDAKNFGLFRQGYKRAINAMKASIERYKAIMFKTAMITEETRNQLVNTLDKLDDEFHQEIKIFYLQVRQFLLDKVNSDHATLIARASTIEVLSQYSLVNDKAMTQLLSKIANRRIITTDENIKSVNFFAREFVREFIKIYKDIDVDLNNCQAIFNAFDVIDKKTAKIPEFIYEK